MKTLLIGNGFDLYHNFPTKYANFLNVTNFLLSQYSNEMKTVGHVLGAQGLHALDKDIARNYSIHKEIFDTTPLNDENITCLIEKGRTNLWFRFLTNYINAQSGWIDFEKEIGRVISAFSKIPTDLVYSNIIPLSDYLAYEDFHMICQFGVFEAIGPFNVSTTEKYFSERTPGTNIKVLNIDSITSTLFEALQELAGMLQAYLNCFVEASLLTMCNVRCLPLHQNFADADIVVTFNYTNTYEQLYKTESRIFHIHGRVNDSIILGINPDEHDELAELDTTFVQFKKYYQRVYLQTDVDYIKFKTGMQTNAKYNPSRELEIIGHSLDITDKDIIVDMFQLATTIKIYCHNHSAIGSYIRNLIAIFGKNGFDSIRESKQLEFVLLNNMVWN